MEENTLKVLFNPEFSKNKLVHKLSEIKPNNFSVFNDMLFCTIGLKSLAKFWFIQKQMCHQN